MEESFLSKSALRLQFISTLTTVAYLLKSSNIYVIITTEFYIDEVKDMSAGICIMNKNAIALAADSAVTIGQHLAIHNSANKLFALSKVAPVGVIIYANAELMDIPAEIIIKQYKNKLSQKTFDSLKEYVDDFLSFLTSNKDLFHFNENEKRYVYNFYVDFLNGLEGDYTRALKRKIDENSRDLTPDELSEVQNDVITSTLAFVDSIQNIQDFDVIEYILANYRKDISEYISKRFPWITGESLNDLTDKTCQLFNKDFFRCGYIGMAFAGYGQDEIFPRMFHLHVGGIISNKIRYAVREEVFISEDSSGAITPFAQTDVMQTFLFGINDEFIGALGKEIPKQIFSTLNGIDNSCFADGKKEEVFEKLSAATPNIIDQIIAKAQKEYLGPIIQSIATLPIEELAMLAESMINITSLRRKVAIDDNIGTVGGPVDVAMITKSDGFIWMKRKHYFEQSYNPQYFYSHYMIHGGGDDDITK